MTTPQQEATEQLAGWHAARAGEIFDFRKGRNWIKGWTLWTEAHVALPARSALASWQVEISKALRNTTRD